MFLLIISTKRQLQLKNYKLSKRCAMDQTGGPLVSQASSLPKHASFFYFQIGLCIINFMISQEVSLQIPPKPLLKPLDDQLPFDDDEFKLEQELMGMSLEDSEASQLNSEFQFKLTEDQTAEETREEEQLLHSFKRSHRATQDPNIRCGSMLAKLQRLQRIPVKKRHF